jgi:hypothetical protein
VTQRFTKWVLAAALTVVTGTGGDAASTRFNVDRCLHASCLGQSMLEKRGYSYDRTGRDSTKVLRRQPEDTVTRLQNKIVRDRARQKQELERTRRHHYPYTDPADFYGLRQLSCPQGRMFVQGEGFTRVYALKCQGRTLTYLAWANGKRVLVTVDPLLGSIISTKPY